MAKTRFLTALAAALLAASGPTPGPAQELPASEVPPAPALQSLLRQSLAVAEGLEVIVSRVQVPPHTALPRHWHPGEEIGYVLEGEITLVMDGAEDTTQAAGEAVVIPARVVHTGVTGALGSTLLVIRVHPEGEPERVLIDE